MTDPGLNKITLTFDGIEDYLLWRLGSGDTAELFDIAVRSARGMGRGRKLVEMMLDELPDTVRFVYAITRESNGIAQEFYNHIGFELTGVLTDFYSIENALMFGKHL